MQFTAEQIADLLEGEVDGDPQVLVSDLAKIEEARSGTLTFLANPRYTDHIYTTKATIAIVNRDFAPGRALPKTLTLIRVADARMAFTILLERNNELQYEKKGYEQPSFVSPKARIGKNVYIGAFSYVGDDVEIGDSVKIFPNCYIGDRCRIAQGTRIHAGVKVYHNTVIGANCVLHSGAVIGADGFGFVPKADGTYEKMPQVGHVILEDQVEIGANTTVDRATIGQTIIRTGTKLDNLVQVGHNADIGAHTVVVSQAGIAGSTKIGNYNQIGGQVGISGHLVIGDRVRIAAQSGIGGNIGDGETVQGSPALPKGLYNRSYVVFKNLPALQKRIDQLERELAEMRAALQAGKGK
ncbi:MAG: UDP-3-O-(3-hydroxymyristoyl)glucosamine N-acyltransferase [Flavobacteriales bacterium]|mgnify:CR=1 FL=1|jgi:UDP-3-O-[3-hydroxymyristoyl] glucosamine N-acyltransferase|nr:UDP-3-O-(3-hydroxymyristoyl)glucosamine N-acyltransferase [Flavobacteriales bacterium]MBK6549712.1 UDP-3-O-(3-hydroxymyristoyl)glucosamine N-acyltransferase [Flavobacteriales bacterium]MBK6883602.1 UDP-3-O-(3-hydroxymyristoyl)glucosamine N-acyltransferase [Flavobacteriales bacterium]MBK7102228.1 UDP-3-O-(3-hydroxymyristoyl)glucosamine N-acyltransferase [Flavobacteriales bacterium]MBK7112967.1 UDP-3-O-(3-hydroxymyristoyl)glucosamine N-acyltransferase [Flavobacteriales bacterium]